MSGTRTRKLRSTLGQFATGVTVVTTVSPDGEAIGVTANSFSSVSLDPPLLLWSLAETANSKESFEEAGHFCVHILTSAQLHVARLFAKAGENKFEGVEWTRGENRLPLLREYVARFVCRREKVLPVGDHIVIIGEILSHERTNKRPLIFHGGSYALADRRLGQFESSTIMVDAVKVRDRRNR